MYIGRFAPSPSGRLHFGSLLAALASYLDARSNHGQWLLRIDDIDPPREAQGATLAIIETLQAFGLQWDGEIVYQSQRSAIYQQALDQLKKNALTYPCCCSRKEILKRTGSIIYDNYCWSHPPSKTDNIVWRFKNNSRTFSWSDTILGHQSLDKSQSIDFILKRRDSLWAYQLAVTVDDAAMGINHIVRGCDLLSEASKQLLLIQALNLPKVTFSHIPVVVNSLGQKLSKQNLAPAITTNRIGYQLYSALVMLGQNPHPSLRNADKSDILLQSIANWDPAAIPLKYSTSHRN